MPVSSSDVDTIANPQGDEGPVERLMHLTATAGFLRSVDGGFYAQVKVGGHRETYALRSAAFRDWLIDGPTPDRLDGRRAPARGALSHPCPLRRSLNHWSGTPSELFAELTTLTGKNTDSSRWPKSPAWLTVELR
jgi:hypothetical protein